MLLDDVDSNDLICMECESSEMFMRERNVCERGGARGKGCNEGTCSDYDEQKMESGTEAKKGANVEVGWRQPRRTKCIATDCVTF